MRDRISSQLRRLEALRRRRGEIEMAVAQVVAVVRARGAAWSAVGAALGVSAQAAQQRYGSLASAGAESTVRGKTNPAASAATPGKKTHHRPHSASRTVAQDHGSMKPGGNTTRTKEENRL